jgi:hypothetical protein
VLGLGLWQPTLPISSSGKEVGENGEMLVGGSLLEVGLECAQGGAARSWRGFPDSEELFERPEIPRLAGGCWVSIVTRSSLLTSFGCDGLLPGLVLPASSRQGLGMVGR